MSTATTVTRCAAVAGRVASDRLLWLGRWCMRHLRWLALWLLLAVVTWLVGSTGTALALLLVGLAPGVLACTWGGLAPRSYELLMARPSRRVRWWSFARGRWLHLARVCGLSDRHVVRTRLTQHGQRDVTRWVAPQLRRVHTRAHSVELKIRARAGQTLADLEAGAERLATTFGAVAHRVWPVSGSRWSCNW